MTPFQLARMTLPPVLYSAGRKVVRYFRPLPLVGGPPDEIELRANLTLKCHPESKIGWQFFAKQHPPSVEEMDQFLEIARGKKMFLDVGAYDGIFSIVFAKLNSESRTIAVEPFAVGFSWMLYNVHINGLHNIEPVHAALSDRCGILTMSQNGGHLNANASGNWSIQCLTGDRLCAVQSFKPQIIKIDVEGHEESVLSGLNQVLADCRPILLLEVHRKFIQRTTGDSDGAIERMIHTLRNLGYHIPKLSHRDNFHLLVSPR